MKKNNFKNLIIYGTGDFAIQVMEYFQNSPIYNILGFTSDAKYNPPTTFQHLPVFNYLKLKDNFPIENTEIFIAVGYSKLNLDRANRFQEIKKMGYTMASYIHPSNIISSNFSIGENCLIMEGNIIQSYVAISNNVIVCVGNRIGHNVTINDSVYISSGVTIGGNTVICKNSFIGFNSAIRNGIVVGENNLIGMNTIINNTTPNNSCYIEEETKIAKYNSKYYSNFL